MELFCITAQSGVLLEDTLQFVSYTISPLAENCTCNSLPGEAMRMPGNMQGWQRNAHPGLLFKQATLAAAILGGSTMAAAILGGSTMAAAMLGGSTVAAILMLNIITFYSALGGSAHAQDLHTVAIYSSVFKPIFLPDPSRGSLPVTV